jgi:chlorite dismutase
VREHGREKEGKPQVVDTRLFMQLQVFTGCRSVGPLAALLREVLPTSVLYEDVNDPLGVGVLTWSADPLHFVTGARAALASEPFARLTPRPELTMLGRTYATGFEPDLEDWLLHRPVRAVTQAAWPWAVWYPLRRTGAFSALPQAEQGAILREHGAIGRAYGEADLAHDIRLACHGLDARDNEFVIGLTGAHLQPLSHVVQTMRRTRQTAEFIQSMGPFFVGHAVRQEA